MTTTRPVATKPRDQLPVRSARTLLSDIRQVCGRRLWLVLVLLFTGVILEGVVVSLAFPVLQAVGTSDKRDRNVVSDTMTDLFNGVGIRPTIVALVSLACLLAAARWLILLWEGALEARIRNEYVEVKRMHLFTALLEARWPFFWDQRTGAIANAVTSHCTWIGTAMAQLVVILQNVGTLLIYTAIAIAANAPVAIATFLFGALLQLGVRPVSTRSRAAGAEMTSRMDEMSTLVQEVVSGVKSIKASASEPFAIDRLRRVAERYTAVATRAFRLTSWLTATFESIAVVVLLLVLVVGVEVLNAPATTVLVVAALIGRMLPRLTTIQQSRQWLLTYLPACQAVDELIIAADSEREIPLRSPTRASSDSTPVAVHIEGLTMAYGTDVVLHDVTIDIAPGRYLGLVGPSGSGKSTLVNCIVRLVDPPPRSVAVDGIDVLDMALDTWRHRVGYVSQESVLFNTTVRENILWSRTDDDHHVLRALELAGAADWVRALPHGLETTVGDRGQLLSGGQRQRIGLARALLGSPSLLILDEATSALDAESEAAILESVARLRSSMTIVSITHRLAAVRGADEIVLLEEGVVVERGQWDELIAKKGRFASLWGLQR